MTSRAYDTITGGVGTFSGWSYESRKGQGLGRPGASWCPAEHETSRNAFPDWATEVSGSSQADLNAIPISISTSWIKSHDGMYATSLECRRLRYHDGPSNRFQMLMRNFAGVAGFWSSLLPPGMHPNRAPRLFDKKRLPDPLHVCRQLSNKMSPA